MTVTLTDLLKDSAYRLDQFKPEHIAALEAGTYETAVRQMVTQRQRATRLLDAAKRADEIAIEDSEASALAHLAAANAPDAAA